MATSKLKGTWLGKILGIGQGADSPRTEDPDATVLKDKPQDLSGAVNTKGVTKATHAEKDGKRTFLKGDKPE